MHCSHTNRSDEVQYNRRQKERVQAVFDAKAPRWAEKGQYATVVGDDCPLDSSAKALVAPGMCVVDLGGGNGKALGKIATFCSGGTVLLVDRSRGMVNAAPDVVAAVVGIRRAFVVADAVRTPLPSSSADVVLLRQVLQHLDAPSAAVREARRLLRPGGQVLIQVPGPLYLDSWLPFNSHADDPIGRFSPAELKDLLAGVDLHAVVSRHPFELRFRDVVAALHFFDANSLLDKLTGYNRATSEVVRSLLQQPMIINLLTRAGDQIAVGGEYLLGVGEKC